MTGLDQATTAVWPTFTRTPALAAASAAWSFGRIPPTRCSPSSPTSRPVIRGTTSPATSTPGTSDTKTSRSCLECDGEHRSRVVGVHVQGAFGKRRDHRDNPGREHLPHLRGDVRFQHPDTAELGHDARTQADLVTEQATGAGAELPHERLVLLLIRTPHVRQRLVARVAASTQELGLDARFGESCGDARAGAVHDRNRRTGRHVMAQDERPARARGASTLDDGQPHRPSHFTF